MINMYISVEGSKKMATYNVILEWRGYKRLLKKDIQGQTHNRVAIIGIIDGLRAITDKDKLVYIHTDIEYIYNTIRYKRHKKWYNNGWSKDDGTTVANKDLWQDYYNISKDFMIRCALDSSNYINNMTRGGGDN